MLKNYFITAIRNFRHHKIFTLINVLGLSVGISAALVIFLIVRYDFSFEKSQKDGNRIYRVVSDMVFSGEPFYNGGVTYPLTDVAPKELNGLEGSAAFYIYNPKVTIPSPNQAKPAVFKYQPHITFADDHYFKLFSFYNWLAGSPETSLQSPFQVVLTAGRAKTYFPDSDLSRIIGRHIVYDDSITCTVTGILKDPTVITDLSSKEFISRSTIPNSGLKGNMGVSDWQGITDNCQFFVKLVPGVTPAQAERQLAELRTKYAGDQHSHDITVQHLQPLMDIHFNGKYGNFNGRLAHKPTLYGLMLVAIFLLLLGCINFINLTTAQAAQRAKEIGIRKTLGSSFRQLMLQFLGETFLLTLLSLLLSFALIPWLLHVFSDFIPPELCFNGLNHPGLLLFMMLLLISVTLLSGLYPAFILSGFKPILVLKNRTYTSATTRKAWLRRTLTVSQFVIAQVFIMAALIVSRQIRYVLDTDLGFKKEGILSIYTPFNWNGSPDNRRFVLLEKLRAIPGIQLSSIGGAPPSDGGSSSSGFKYKDGKKEIETQVQLKYGDSNYIPLYHLRLLAGRYAQTSDTMREIAINETYARLLGFSNPHQAIGKMVDMGRGHYPIVGVISDFHQASLHIPIKPLAITGTKGSFYTIHIALQPQPPGSSTWKTTIAQLEKTFKSIYPEEDFHYEFYDESIAKFYTTEQNISRLLRWATGLTVFISCLGLLGLVIYSTNLRTKEIGVRKVLGASVTQIIAILSKDFVKLVGIAFLIAVPIAWYAAWKWLEDFAYRASVPWWVFAASGLAMISIALLTLSIRTIRAANANPVNCLRSE
jgi:putative ABC transport system permease protein